ncbi:MAG: monofunctional biosynthetic peptidoglycan transglycosylase [Bacteroidota bacterium]|nr:monofunctional biosynthetic peptidoglycan transglycosylase [Bacteroidota bacterium]
MKEAIAALYTIYLGLKIWQKFLFWISFVILLHFVYVISLLIFFPPITLTQLNSQLTGHGLYRDYVSLKNISSHAVLAVIASEDQLFADHFGLDFESIEKAKEHNKKKKRKRGASTISQQVAKNVFLWQGRSWIRKGLEVYFTGLIEILWSKRRIVEIYLNIAEMGEGVFGIEAASQRFFRKPAKFLTMNESAMIAASLPNPKRYRVKPVSAWVNFRTPWIINQMNRLKYDEDINKILVCAYNAK